MFDRLMEPYLLQLTLLSISVAVLDRKQRTMHNPRCQRRSLWQGGSICQSIARFFGPLRRTTISARCLEYISAICARGLSRLKTRLTAECAGEYIENNKERE